MTPDSRQTSAWRSPGPLGSLAAVMILALSGPAAAASSQPVLLSYELWIGGLQALSLDARLARGSDRYRVDLTARTEGLVGWFHPYVLVAQASGAYGAKGIRPKRFVSDSREPGRHKRRTLTYLADGTVSVVTERSRRPGPPPTAADRGRGTVDPVAALISILERLALGNACAGALPVFDGKRRYTLRATHLGRREVRPSRYALFSGEATLCRLDLQPMAGFKARRLPSRVDVWVAPAAGDGHPIPVRLEARGRLGGMVMHLVAVRRRPSNDAPP